MYSKQNQYLTYYRYQGRKISKKISKSNLNLLANYYDLYSYDQKIIEYFESHKKNKSIDFSSSPFRKINIEIGFGDGEYLLKSAIKKPNELFIGIEFYKNGIAKILKSILDFNLQNIKLCNLNSMFFLSALPKNSVDTLLIINPDPWPKKKHEKRRLISHKNLSIFKRVVKSKNSIYITTDSISYLNYIKNIISNNHKKLFDHDIATLSKNDELYGVSRYQRKAIENGGNIYQITI